MKKKKAIIGERMTEWRRWSERGGGRERKKVMAVINASARGHCHRSINSFIQNLKKQRNK